MEGMLGVEQSAIGKECCDFNLHKGTMAKVGEMCDDGKVRYLIDVSYDMGWQKAKKTYYSISGHGLMIGNATKNVVTFQNFLLPVDSVLVTEGRQTPMHPFLTTNARRTTLAAPRAWKPKLLSTVSTKSGRMQTLQHLLV